MWNNKTRIDLNTGAAPLLLPSGFKLDINIDEAMLRQLLTFPPGESVGLGQPFSFAGNPPDLGQSYEITVASSAGDLSLAASVTRVVGDHEVELIATRLGADVPSDYKVTLEQLDFDKERPWLWVTIVRLPILTSPQAVVEGPEEDEGDRVDDDLDEDADEFEDPDAVDDLYEEMTERHREPWPEEEGEPSPSSEDPLLDLSGGES